VSLAIQWAKPAIPCLPTLRMEAMDALQHGDLA
jgi:hypothetical protein